MAPLRQATYSAEGARAAMRGARHQPTYSTARRHVYFVARTKEWLTAEPVDGGRFRVSWFGSCPC